MKKQSRKELKGKKGQSLVEYVIIVVIVAIAAIGIVSVFSGRIQEMFGGATAELGGDQSAIDGAVDTDPASKLQDLDQEGFD